PALDAPLRHDQDYPYATRDPLEQRRDLGARWCQGGKPNRVARGFNHPHDARMNVLVGDHFMGAPRTAGAHHNLVVPREIATLSGALDSSSELTLVLRC